MYGFYGFDSTYVLVMIGMAIAMFAQHKVSSTFAKYDMLETQFRMTGREVAREILEVSGIDNVAVEHISGHLSDHYDSRNKVLRLSDSTDQSISVAAVAVAAHECGHALQDQHNYAPLRLRNALVPVTQLGSTLAMPLIFAGLMLGFAGLIQIGILAFSAVLVFQLVTLPVEFDASRRALKVLEQRNLLAPDELPAARKVLNAAALTYVAASVSTALQLARFIILANNRSRD